MACQVHLPVGWGEAWLCEPGAHQAKGYGTARAYDHMGYQLVWTPRRCNATIRFACDVEHLARSPVLVADYFGQAEEEFIRRWVLTEVLAKLVNIPVLCWLKCYGLVHSLNEGVAKLKVSRFGPSREVILVAKTRKVVNRVVAFGFLRIHTTQNQKARGAISHARPVWNSRDENEIPSQLVGRRVKRCLP